MSPSFLRIYELSFFTDQTSQTQAMLRKKEDSEESQLCSAASNLTTIPQSLSASAPQLSLDEWQTVHHRAKKKAAEKESDQVGNHDEK